MSAAEAAREVAEARREVKAAVSAFRALRALSPEWEGEPAQADAAGALARHLAQAGGHAGTAAALLSCYAAPAPTAEELDERAEEAREAWREAH